MKFLIRALKITLISTGISVILVVILFGHSDITVDELKSEYAPSPSSFLPLNKMEVHYRDEGIREDSIPIILIHGTGASLHTFSYWADQLKVDRRVIRMDLPAYGLTGPFPDKNYSIENYVEFLRDFLRSLKVDKCILAGNSLGGQIAWRFTLEHPEMVDKLVLIDAAGYPYNSKSIPLAFRLARTPVLKNILTYITPRSIVKSSVENVYYDKSKVNEELVDRYFKLSLREGNRQALIDRFQAKNDTSIYHQLNRIEQKTLIIWGQDDNLIPVGNAYRFHNDMANSSLTILENSGHVPMEENPEESLQVLIGFLNHSKTE